MHREIEEFIKLEPTDQWAERTEEKYRRNLQQFSDWLEENDLHPHDVDTRDMKRYIQTFLKEEKGYAPKTVRAKVAPVNLFLSDASSEGYIEHNPLNDIRLSRYAPDKAKKAERAEQDRVHLSEDEINDLIANVPSPKLRNRLLIQFIYFTGLRKTEVSNIKIEDLDVDDREVEVQVKGDKNHTARWGSQLDPLLDTWMNGGYRDSSIYAADSDYLFLTQQSAKISSRHINKIIDKSASRAGIQEELYDDSAGQPRKRVTAHALRHSYAVHFLDNGGTLEGLKENLGHEFVKTTEVYGDISEERGKKEARKYAPNQKFSGTEERDKCFVCGQRMNLIDHHKSYQPEEIVELCPSCHQQLHENDEPEKLIPDMSRKEAEKRGLID
ncbi:MAG: tyrosine-type recombinase/integrase [Haloarculaceae archaeon]